MTDKNTKATRRTIVTALGTGVATLGALGAAREAAAKGRSWQPAMESEDDWLEMPGRHRFVFDATSPDGAGGALFFVKNYIDVNKTGYGLAPSQLANVVILRHFATIFGYGDPVWAKYGEAFAKVTHFMNPKTKEAPERNLYNVERFGGGLPNQGTTLSSLAALGVRFGVCGLATQKIAEMIAGETGGKADDVRAEFSGNLVANARLVPAGIVAVNRAQERGYALAYIG